MKRGESAGDEEDAIAQNGTGDELFGRPIDHPKLVSIVWIVTGRAFAAGENHLHLPASFGDQGHAIGARVIRPRC